MAYKIIFMKGEHVLAVTPLDQGLDAAKVHAEDHMVIKGADRVVIKGADRVEIKDENNNNLIFHHPRMMHA